MKEEQKLIFSGFGSFLGNVEKGRWFKNEYGIVYLHRRLKSENKTKICLGK